jgi:hypothetical protein
MIDSYYKKINLAGAPIYIYIDDNFKNIRNFIDKFANDYSENGNKKLRVFFSKGERRVLLSNEYESLYITGNDIDDLFNPFNLIGITQALFRFAAIHLMPKGIFLLHGSTAILDNKTICFGDDGSSTAKTLGSLEVALDSNYYVADEFCFFNSQTKKIFGYRFIPIHIRPAVKEHLENYHELSFPKSNYKKTMAGEFIEQDGLFETISAELTTLLYISFSQKNQKIQKLSKHNAIKSFKFCITAHVAKLLYPNLDRMQFSSMTDSNDLKIINEKIVNEILEKTLDDRKIISRIVEQISSHRLTVSHPCQINALIRKEIC